MRTIKTPAEIINIIDILDDKGKYLKGDNQYYSKKELLNTIGSTLVEIYNDDLNSRKQWEETVISIIKLFNSYMDAKNDPWEGCSNVNLPFIAIATLQFHARAIDTIMPSKNIVSVLELSGNNDADRVRRVTKYMNYQLLHKMESFEDSFDKGLMMLPLVGSMFKKTYYNVQTNQVDSIYVNPLDVVVNYYANDINNAIVTHRYYLSVNEIRERVRDGLFIEEAWDFGEGSYYANDRSRQVIDEMEGRKPPMHNNPRLFLEINANWDIDGDGIQEPYVFTIDYETSKVVRITDRTYYDMKGNPHIINYWTHYTFFPNPVGFYGLGFGILLGGLNKSANDILNEIIDSGTLATKQGGFVSALSGAPKGGISFQHGEFIPIEIYTDDINKVIKEFNFSGPNQTLYATLGLLYEYSKLVTGLSETMTGQLPASDTPATTILALLEEGRKLFSSIHKRIHRSFKKELEKIYRLNSIFIQADEYFPVVADGIIPEPTPEILKVIGTDFDDDLKIIPVSDPFIISSSERIIKAKEVMQTVYTNPDLSQNPQARFIALKHYLTAIDAPDIDIMLQPPPPPPILSPIEENTEFIKGGNPVVMQEHNHPEHIKLHEALLNDKSVFGLSLSPETRRFIEAHNKVHLSFMYQMMNMQENMNI